MGSDQKDSSSIYELALNKLELSTRLSNCCRVARVRTIGELAALRSGDVLRWQNAGRKTLVEVRGLLGSLGLKLSDDLLPTGMIDEKLVEKILPGGSASALRVVNEVDGPNVVYLMTSPPAVQINLIVLVTELDLSVRARNVVVQSDLKYVGELAQLTSAQILKWSNAGRKTVSEISAALASRDLSLGMAIPDWSRDRAMSLRVTLGDFLARQAREKKTEILQSVGPEPKYVEDELRRFLRSVSAERDTEILTRLWGWGGDGARTLDSVGREFDLTRERVRQIELRALSKLRSRGFEPLLMQAALRAMRGAVPDTDLSIGQKLQELRLSRVVFFPNGLRTAVEHFGTTWPFLFVVIDGVRIHLLADEKQQCTKAIQLLRRKTSDRGCANIASLSAEVGLSESKVRQLAVVLQSLSKIVWLDEQREWLCSTEVTRNRLYNLCSKVLGIAPNLHLSELRRAVSKSRRLAMCPPQRVLANFIKSVGLGRVDGTVVRANPGVGKAPLEESAEGLMLRALERHGPVMDGEEFAESCIALGMNATTFYIYRLVSPVICALGKNLYCRTGAEIPPGTIEEIIGRRRTIAPRVSDHGWTSAGRLWCGIELTRQILTGGGIRLPSFVANLVQGDWVVALPDASEFGTAVCRNQYIHSFRKQLAVLGAEPSDIATFEFDTKLRTVLIRVGGLELLETVQGAESTIAEDAAEDAVEGA